MPAWDSFIWLCRVFIAAWTFLQLQRVGALMLRTWAQQSWHMAACGISPDQGLNPSPAFAGGLFSTEPAGKSPFETAVQSQGSPASGC